jgi:oxygen-independent coproporphyrinogen-3 oxidase
MGIPRSRFSQMTGGEKLDDVLDKDALQLFIEANLLIKEDKTKDDLGCFIPKELLYEWEKSGGIRPTESGLERIDYILPRLLKVKSINE